MEAARQPTTDSDLVVSGTIKGAPSSTVDLVVVIERVVADDALPEIIGLYGTCAGTDAAGLFVDRYTPSDDVRQQLHGWVMCTVMVVSDVPGAGGYSKTVRWQRQSSSELMSGLSGLLAGVSFDVEVVTS
jgi:hypothetical protein